jgi:hypothetical protein
MWGAIAVAREFHTLPSVAARALDDDPEQLDILALDLLHYAEAHAIHRTAKKELIDAWKDDPIMREVQEYDAEIVGDETGLGRMPTADELRALGYQIIGDDPDDGSPHPA